MADDEWCVFYGSCQQSCISCCVGWFVVHWCRVDKHWQSNDAFELFGVLRHDAERIEATVDICFRLPLELISTTNDHIFQQRDSRSRSSAQSSAVDAHDLELDFVHIRIG